MGPIAQFNPSLLDANNQKPEKLKWVDHHTFGAEPLAFEGDPE